MKFKFSTLVAGALAGLLCIATGCARVDELDNRVTDLEKKFADLNPRLSSYEEQIRTLTEFKTTIEGMDLQGKFNAINQETAKIAGIITRLDNLDGAEGEIARIKAELAALEGQGAQTIYDYIDKQIQSLSNRIKNDSTALETYKKSTNSTLTAIINAVSQLQGQIFTQEDGTTYSNIQLLIEAVLGIWDDIDALYGNDGFLYGKILDNADSIDVLAGEIAKLAGLYGELQTTCGDLNSRLSAIEADYLTKTAFDQYTRSAGEKAAAFAQKMKLDSTMFANNIEKLDAKIKLDSILFAGQIRDLAAKERQDSALLAGKIKDLEDKNIEIGNDINKLNVKVAALEEADSLLQDQIDSTVNRVTTLEEKVDGLVRTIGLLPDDIKGFTEQVANHSEAINALNGYVQDLQGRMIKVEDLLAHRIQSLVYVPDYSDGKITIYTEVLKANDTTEVNLDDVTTGINYQVKPANLADTLVAAWKARALKVSFDAARVETRGADIKGVIAFDEIVGVKVADKENGIITITVDPNDSTVAHGYVNNSAIALVLSDENGNSRTTEYTNTTTKGGQSYQIVFQHAHSFGDTLVSMPYNKTDVATFFENVEPLFRLVPKGATIGEEYTVAQLKALGHNIAPYVEVANEVIYPDEETKTNFDVADDSTTVSVNLISDRTKTVESVGDTLKVIKKMYVKGAVDTCKARASFAVTPLSLHAAFKSTTDIVWDFDQDVTGDRNQFTKVNDFTYGRQKVALSLVSEDITTSSALTPESFSHQEPRSFDVYKVVEGDTTKLDGSERANFAIKPGIDLSKTPAEFRLDTLGGFNFNATKYIVEAKYAVTATETAPVCDTAYVKLDVTLQDRNRDVLAYTYPATTLKVDTNFGGQLEYFVYKPNADTTKNEYNYYAELPYTNGGDPDLVAKWYNWTAIYSKVGDVIDSVANTKDSIKVFVPYSAANLEKYTTTSFTLKDTVVLGYGQKIALEFPVVLEWPVYDLAHNPYFVAGDEATGFYSEVKPKYENEAGGYDEENLYTYNVFEVDMNQNFSIVDAAGAKVDTTGLGIEVEYALVPECGNVTIDAGKVAYTDSLEQVGVTAKLYLNIDGSKFTIPTSFDEGGKYFTYAVRRYVPFKYFGLVEGGDPSVLVDQVKTYEINVREFISLIDTRGYECLDYTQNNNWVMGDGLNGFAAGRSAKKAYNGDHISIRINKTGIPDEIADKLHFGKSGDGENPDCLYFEYDGQQYLQKDIVVPVEVSFSHSYVGTMKGSFNVTFKKEK